MGPKLTASGAVLFVSGLNLGSLATSRRSGADLVCVDLEDAVPPDQKERARADLLAALRSVESAGPSPVIVRVNALPSWAGIADLQTCLALGDRIAGIMLPKVDSADEIRWAAALADDANSPLAMLAIIETARGLADVAAIAASHERLRALVFGGFDLSTALGCAMAWEPLAYARSAVVHAAALAGIDVIDAPHAAIDDTDGLRAATERSKALGMTGKVAKDARQIAIIQEVLRPSPQEIADARRIVGMFDAAPGAPLIIDGRLIELPTIRRLRRIGASS